MRPIAAQNTKSDDGRRNGARSLRPCTPRFPSPFFVPLCVFCGQILLPSGRWLRETGERERKWGLEGGASCSPWGLPEWRWIFRPLVGGQACRRPKASCRPVVVVKVRRPRRPTGMSSAQSPGMAARRASLVRWGDAGEGATAGRLRCLQPFFKRPGAWPGSRQRAMGKKGEIILLTQICPWLYSVIVEREGSTCQAIFRTKLLSIFETDGRTLER